MRKISAGLFISLDGVVEAPETWHFPYFNDEMGADVGSQMERAGAFLLGRKTYQGFAEYWPTVDPAEEPAAAIMNEKPKIVVSDTMTSADWQNSTIVKGSELRSLKESDGPDLGITGSITLVRSLLQDDLLDELNLLVHPLVVGSGMRLFEPGTPQTPLKLLSSRTFDNGVLSLSYTKA
jgi:dihydrofolate reductase